MTEIQKKRSGCLSTLLVFLMVVYILGAVGSFLAGPLMKGNIPGYAPGSGPITGIMYLIYVIFLIGIWRYKKWGFYGYLGVTIVGIIIELYLGGGIAGALLSLVFPIILFLLIRPIWSYMR